MTQTPTVISAPKLYLLTNDDEFPLLACTLATGSCLLQFVPLYRH